MAGVYRGSLGRDLGPAPAAAHEGPPAVGADRGAAAPIGDPAGRAIGSRCPTAEDFFPVRAALAGAVGPGRRPAGRAAAGLQAAAPAGCKLVGRVSDRPAGNDRSRPGADLANRVAASLLQRGCGAMQLECRLDAAFPAPGPDLGRPVSPDGLGQASLAQTSQKQMAQFPLRTFPRRSQLRTRNRWRRNIGCLS